MGGAAHTHSPRSTVLTSHTTTSCFPPTPTIQAVKVFESATTDAVGERSPALWLEYARFCRERGKVANAQKVYLRAVEVLEPAQVGCVVCCIYMWMGFWVF